MSCSPQINSLGKTCRNGSGREEGGGQRKDMKKIVLNSVCVLENAMILGYSYLNTLLFVCLYIEICIGEMISFQSGFKQGNRPSGETDGKGSSRSSDHMQL